MAKILIIEDESAIRRVLSKILVEESKEYEVEEAVDGIDLRVLPRLLGGLLSADREAKREEPQEGEEDFHVDSVW